MIKVAFLGYRSWASRIFENLTNDKTRSWEIVDPSEANVILYYGWSWKIPKEVYENKLCLILHPSPLPKYRGGSPLQHQIMNGEKMSAVTIFKVEEEIDSGAIYSQCDFSLVGTLDDIFARIVSIGTRDTMKVLNYISHGVKPLKQKHSQATYVKRRTPEQSEIAIEDLEHTPAEELYNFIRALADPYPNAFIKCADGKKLYITGAKIEQD